MTLRTTFIKKIFHFNFDARTSRGRMRDKTSWFIKLWDEAKPEVIGVGECGPLPGLSVDAKPDFEEVLQNTLEKVSTLRINKKDDWQHVASVVPEGFPSIYFGLETAVLDLMNGGKRIIFENSFLKSKPIPINGLVWMGDLDLMLQQAADKISEGFTCIKIKVGGLNFEKECDILHYIRRKYFREEITIRLDANGAFKPDDALYKLNDLSRFKIHSIEQPVKAGLPIMEELCIKSPIPIALDEELIGVEGEVEKRKLLERIKPQFIILKPTLHGGFKGSKEWIAIADSLGIGWWITSALESNIGLNAIGQFAANYPVQIPQGLGTGLLYDDNFPSPMEIVKGQLIYNPKLSWNLNDLGIGPDEPDPDEGLLLP